MKKLIAISAVLFAFVLNAQAQEEDTSPPTVTMDAPVNGVPVETDRVTVTGEASDDTGVRRVQYRLEGSRRWRDAILTAPNETSTTYVFSYKNKKKGRARRVYVRCLDAAKNESDTIGRKVFRSRTTTRPT